MPRSWRLPSLLPLAGLSLCGLRTVGSPGFALPASAPMALTGTTGQQQGRQGSAGRGAIMEPPTRHAPPDTTSKTQGKRHEWVECAVEECHNEECRHYENWVFRGEHIKDYQAFLGVRNVEPAGFLPGRHEYGAAKRKGLSTQVTCRKRSIDASLRCADCIRLVLGGPYGARGVAVGAFPPQDGVMGCLGLSAMLPENDPRPGEKWDTNQEIPRQTAFCNTVNLKM